MDTLDVLIHEADRLYNRGSYEKAFLLFLRLAEQGNPHALFMLGNMHRYGEGIPVDYEKAVKYYRLAIEQGHRKACYYLALMYYQGYGVKKNVVEAARLLRLSMDGKGDE